jgi:hypothetical protein
MGKIKHQARLNLEKIRIEQAPNAAATRFNVFLLFSS